MTVRGAFFYGMSRFKETEKIFKVWIEYINEITLIFVYIIKFQDFHQITQKKFLQCLKYINLLIFCRSIRMIPHKIKSIIKPACIPLWYYIRNENMQLQSLDFIEKGLNQKEIEKQRGHIPLWVFWLSFEIIVQDTKKDKTDHFKFF